MSKIKKLTSQPRVQVNWPERQGDHVPQTKKPAVQGIAQGIALCLGQLADEAAMMGMNETFAAIRCAIGTCLMEEAGLEAIDPGDAVMSIRH